jgi:glycosyltransferase involved in cell wall biosynthesis
MAGPAIRCLELSKQLAEDFDVTVCTPRPSDLSLPPGSPKLLAGAAKSKVYELAQESDIIFVQANVLKPYPGLARLGKHLVVDLYDPYLLSVLAQYKDDKVSAASSYSLMHKVLEKHMIAADFAVCASERQRDYWLGRYCALGRLVPEVYDFDPSFRKVIDVVPFGLPSQAPASKRKALKGVVPGINEGDIVLLWGGGIWEWFDPITVIDAVHATASKMPNLRLYFMGWKSPNPQVPLMPMARQARQRAQDLGILDKHVFFSEDWTSYEDRVNILMESDIAVSAHFDLPETRFSFRTRILDYLWASLPTLTTCGDQLAEDIVRSSAGESLPYGNVQAWAQAIERLASDKQLRAKYSAGAASLSEQFQWNKVVEPLKQYCAKPHKLPEFKRVRMPSLVERARAVYSRGGKDLVLKRSAEILADVLRV